MFTDQKYQHEDTECGHSEACKNCIFNRNKVDQQPNSEERYFGSYPFDMDEFISKMIDSHK